MSKKDFTITLFPEHMKAVEDSLPFHHQDKRDTLFFTFDSRPNLDTGDSFTARILLEEPKKGSKSDIIRMDAQVVDIVPPLLQPPDEGRFQAHTEVAGKYLRNEVMEKMRADYFGGNTQKSVWTVYFKKIKQPAAE